MKILITWLTSALAIFLSASLVPGTYINNFGTALIAAVILGAVNAIIRPVLVILTLPINILTFGIFTFFINASMVSLTALLLPGFAVKGFWTSLLYSLVLSLISVIIEDLSKKQYFKRI